MVNCTSERRHQSRNVEGIDRLWILVYDKLMLEVSILIINRNVGEHFLRKYL